jgi:hypothetical protein
MRLSKQSRLEAKLRFACEVLGGEGFELVLANPEAKDMFDLVFEPFEKAMSPSQIGDKPALLLGTSRQSKGRLAG